MPGVVACYDAEVSDLLAQDGLSRLLDPGSAYTPAEFDRARERIVQVLAGMFDADLVFQQEVGDILWHEDVTLPQLNARVRRYLGDNDTPKGPVSSVLVQLGDMWRNRRKRRLW
ncbi:hypothetical protein Q8F55_004321 [Vanrija albida]|uniref:Uncharacterized protein n=1 Tax=Vanrija albida TaxID=181172 RepID=A0ABR3Q6F4_9TREE